MRSAYLFAASSALLFACAAPMPDEAAGESTSNIETGNETPGADAILVQQAQRVVSMKIGSDGTLIDSGIEYAMFAGSEVLASSYESQEGTYACTFAGGTHEGKWQVGQLALSAPDGASTILVPAASKDESDFQLTQGAEIKGHVGPYVFVRESSYFFGCGAAHPSFGVKAFVWDTKGHQTVTFEAPAAALEQARAQLAGKGFEGEEPKLAELTPRFDAQGHLSIDYRFEKAASHAEADSLGNDYSVSATINSTAIDAPLPAELEALKDPPASIAAYLAAEPNAAAANPILGWSQRQ